jgi:protein-disulfide isomerase
MTMTTNRILLVLMAIGGLSGGAAIVRSESALASPPVPSMPGTEPQERNNDIRVDDSVPQRGPKDAPVTLTVFADFQCPFCARLDTTLKQLEVTYGSSIRIAWRNQPLPFHANAMLAAKAAMVAHEQGKFWTFHDLLFAHMDALERPALERYARDAGLDVRAFNAALDTDAPYQRVSVDVNEAQRLKVTGTPTTFVNGHRLVGAQPFETFAQAIDEELGHHAH